LGFSVTASMFVRRSVFEEVGGFRNGIPEDRDWCESVRLTLPLLESGFDRRHRTCAELLAFSGRDHQSS
jgi:GT2 family glycosyltransferase